MIRLVLAWWAYEEVLVLGCSGWRMLTPWVVGPGEEQCSAYLGFKLGSISLVAVGWIASTLLDNLNKVKS